MADRITIRHLRALAAHLNKLTGSPTEYFGEGPLPAGSRVINVGHFHISSAYGGYSLHRTVNTSGGVTQPFGYGHVPARQLYDQLQAFIRGIEFERAASVAKITPKE